MRDLLDLIFDGPGSIRALLRDALTCAAFVLTGFGLLWLMPLADAVLR